MISLTYFFLLFCHHFFSWSRDPIFGCHWIEMNNFTYNNRRPVKPTVSGSPSFQQNLTIDAPFIKSGYNFYQSHSPLVRVFPTIFNGKTRKNAYYWITRPVEVAPWFKHFYIFFKTHRRYFLFTSYYFCTGLFSKNIFFLYIFFSKLTVDTCFFFCLDHIIKFLSIFLHIFLKNVVTFFCNRRLRILKPGSVKKQYYQSGVPPVASRGRRHCAPLYLLNHIISLYLL